MSITVLLPLLFSGQPTCSVQGVPLLEMRQGSDREGVIATTKIYRSGAWTMGSQRGCFDRHELRTIRLAMQQATWKAVASPVACFAYDPNYTQYRVNGRLRFTERFCSGKAADAATAHAISLVKQELADEVAPVAACRAVGPTLFEIHKRADTALPTSTTKLYANGAYTFQPIDASGKLGALTTRCLDRATLAKVRSSIASSPWTTEISGLTCKAYSPNFTEYVVRGRLEYTARLCGRERLDDASLASIQLIEAAIAKPETPPAGC